MESGEQNFREGERTFGGGTSRSFDSSMVDDECGEVLDINDLCSDLASEEQQL